MPAEHKDESTKIREEQQRQDDEKKREDDERKRQREAAMKRMDESTPTPTQEENDEAVLKARGGGEVNPALRQSKTSEAGQPTSTYSTRTATPTPKEKQQ